MAEIKAYRPENRSLSQGQVLPRAYSPDAARLIVREMADQLALDLVRRGAAADQIVLDIGYDHTGIPLDYDGALSHDHYGKILPKPAHGSANLGRFTASSKLLTQAAVQLYDRIADPRLLVRRVNIAANHALRECELPADTAPVQYGLFDDVDALERRRKQENLALEKEHSLQEAILSLKSRYGKNAVLRGMNFEQDATTRLRNGQVGGHSA